jgi:anti-anti-sigma factor
MEISLVDSESGVGRVRLAGRLDSAGVDHVELKFNAATAARDADVIVDLAGVSFLASMGVRMLVAAAKALAAKGHRVILLNPQAAVDEFLEATALYELLPVARNEEEAQALLASSAD